jgi:cytidylate kinase
MQAGRVFTVAIDGPAAAGKGTVARAVAARFGFAHLDTGLLYRAVGARAAAGEDPVAAARGLGPADLARGDLRSLAAGQWASRVAVIPEVRAALVDFQRGFARRAGGAVLDGRDIGTVICPEAEVKLYVTASDEVRAARRRAEGGGAGGPARARRPRRGARRGADAARTRCGLARHERSHYRRGRRKGGGPCRCRAGTRPGLRPAPPPVRPRDARPAEPTAWPVTTRKGNCSHVC